MNIPYHRSYECPICAAKMTSCFAMLELPLTELFVSASEPFKNAGYLSQQFLYCEGCSHGKLSAIIEPEFLYLNRYHHRTSKSRSAENAAIRFASFVQSSAGGFDTVIDIGGSDGLLVDCFLDVTRVVVDPNATVDDGVAISNLFGDADLSAYRKAHKLILCSHTLEHIENVNAFMVKVASIWRDGDVLALSVPSLDCLLEDGRIDHIHHQHIHYFSLRSMGLLLAKHGFGITKVSFDHQHWGALMLLCERKTGSVSSRIIPGKAILCARITYLDFMHTISVPKVAIAFGAALMLPLLHYYLPELTNVTEIADNDPSKNGLRYINFDKRITNDYDLCDRDVVITAVTSKMSARSLVIEALNKGARNVTVPLRAL